MGGLVLAVRPGNDAVSASRGMSLIGGKLFSSGLFTARVVKLARGRLEA